MIIIIKYRSLIDNEHHYRNNKNVIVEFLNIRVKTFGLEIIAMVLYGDIKFNIARFLEERGGKEEEAQRERERESSSRPSRRARIYKIGRPRTQSRCVRACPCKLIYTRRLSLSLGWFPTGFDICPRPRSAVRLPREGCDTRDTSHPPLGPSATNRGNTTSRESLTSCASHRISARPVQHLLACARGSRFCTAGNHMTHLVSV